MNGRARLALCALLGVGGLALYLWPALAAPVVLWSDSRTDLDWARAGVGIVSPAPPPTIPHPAKPGYLAFLRIAAAGASEETAPRQIVVVQSILLWLSIAGVSLFLGFRTTMVRGASLYVLLLLFLRLRDSSSAVMSEPLAAALFLPLAAFILLVPLAGPVRAVVLGCACAVLFLVRPNVGAAAVLLFAVAFVCSGIRPRRWRTLVQFALGFGVLVLPVWWLTASPRNSLYGLEANFEIARMPYAWTPGVAGGGGLEPENPVDARRQLVWRALHGVFGLEFYDSRWSSAYALAAEWARRIGPLLLCVAIAGFIAPSPRAPRLARRMGLALLIVLVAQSFLLGALPRLALPMLPALLLMAVVAWPPRFVAAAASLALILAALAWQSQVLDREWGMVEASGVQIRQTLPRGSLPRAAPATLHIRIAPALLPAAADLRVLGPSGEELYDSRFDTDRGRPFVTIALPQPLLDGNLRAPVSLMLVSSGSYGPHQYLLFPVILRPWAPAAEREGSSELSPSTGIRMGSLDWWAHSGGEGR